MPDFAIESRTFHHCVLSLAGVVPGEPTDVVVTEATKSYVVLAWKPPVQRGHEGVMYYIEKVRKTRLLYCTVSMTEITSSYNIFIRINKYLLD